MIFTTAIVKTPASTFAQGISSGLNGTPDLEKTFAQHKAYCQAIEQCGLQLIILEADSLYPDSTFVEDIAIVAKGFAIITNPGNELRKGEIQAVESCVKTSPSFQRLYRITSPGTLDGGDICEADGSFYIGISQRTNPAGAEQLAQFLFKEGFSSTVVDIRNIPSLLHLKSGIAYLSNGQIILINELKNLDVFKHMHIIEVEAAENYAANCILVNQTVLIARGFPKLQLTIEKLGYKIFSLDMSEFQKMDGGLSCLSLRF